MTLRLDQLSPGVPQPNPRRHLHTGYPVGAKAILDNLTDHIGRPSMLTQPGATVVEVQDVPELRLGPVVRPAALHPDEVTA